MNLEQHLITQLVTGKASGCLGPAHVASCGVCGGDKEKQNQITKNWARMGAL